MIEGLGTARWCLPGRIGRRLLNSAPVGWPSTTVERLDSLSEAIDDILNTLLFLRMAWGLSVLDFNRRYLFAGTAAIGIVPIPRLTPIAVSTALVCDHRALRRGTIWILT